MSDYMFGTFFGIIVGINLALLSVVYLREAVNETIKSFKGKTDEEKRNADPWTFALSIMYLVFAGLWSTCIIFAEKVGHNADVDSFAIKSALLSLIGAFIIVQSIIRVWTKMEHDNAKFKGIIGFQLKTL